MSAEPTQEQINSLYQKLFKEAGSSGYHLNPDTEFTKDLVKGILINQERYGYWACPCRLATGEKSKDLDIICPCDYRDPDLNEYDMCYCCLYVTEKVLRREKQPMTIPERRPPLEKRSEARAPISETLVSGISFPVFRCKVCGYLCAREHPPEVCPICKAKKERFERFI